MASLFKPHQKESAHSSANTEKHRIHFPSLHLHHSSNGRANESLASVPRDLPLLTTSSQTCSSPPEAPLLTGNLMSPADSESTLTESPSLDERERSVCAVHDAKNTVARVIRNHPRVKTLSGSLGLGVIIAELASEEGMSKTVAKPIDAGTQESGTFPKIHHIFDHIPLVIKVLEEVGKIHPFIHVAVFTFKTFYTLEMQRRHNEDKVIAVLVEINGMLEVLQHLRKVDRRTMDEEEVKIEDQMKALVDQTAADITHCANVCDAYTKTKLVGKVLKGPIWEIKFSSFVQLFARRRDDFKFILTTYISVKVDELDKKMDNLTETTEQILQLIKNVPAEQKSLFDEVERRGGRAVVLHDEVALHEVLTLAPAEDKAHTTEKQVAGRLRDNIEDVKKDLEDPAVVIERNLQAFERKFNMQQKQLLDEVEKVVHRESDRVIESLKSGPHDRILDKDLHSLWSDMGWRGNVKARHFVLAVRDYYHEKAEESKHKQTTAEDYSSINADSWALPWITVKRLQSIVEAFDDDASGYITITEVNNFTRSRPANWSLLHWLAYWAIGWQSSATIYRDKIHELFGKMFSLRSSIHKANHRLVDKYLDHVWQPIILLTSSFQSFVATEKVQARFKSYVDNEEGRIRQNLKDANYHIDDLATLVLVTGPGRIDKYLFQLIYLIIKRDLEVMRLCQTKVIHERDLSDSIRSLRLVMAAVDDRHKELEEIFRHQNLDPQQQFKMTYCKLFDHYHDPGVLFTRKKLRDSRLSEHHDDATDDAEDIDAGAILNHPHDSINELNEWGCEVDLAAYDVFEDIETLADRRVEGPLVAIVGSWSAFLYGNDGQPAAPMFSIFLRVSNDDSRKVMASGKIPGSSMFANFNLDGHCEIDAESAWCYTFVMECSAPFESKRLHGRLSQNWMTLSGTWGPPNVTSGYFVLTKLPPDILSYRPSPTELQRNKTRALWSFAQLVVLDQVVKKRWSWTYFKKRRDSRNRYVELLCRTYYGRPLDRDEEQELKQYRRTLTPSDARFYQSLCHQRLRLACHHGVVCDSCGGIINGARVVCLDCDTHGKIFSTIDLCEDRRCVAAQIGLDRRADLPCPHLPSHNVLKSRTVIHLRDFGRIELQALDALQRANAAFVDIEDRRREPLIKSLAGDRTVKNRQADLVCIACKGDLTRPCWYCIDCECNVFICNACDARGGISQGEHKPLHILVRCLAREFDENGLPMDERLDSWESKLGEIDGTLIHVNGQMSEMDNRLLQMEARLSKVDGRLTQVDQRLARIETLMETVLSKLA